MDSTKENFPESCQKDDGSETSHVIAGANYLDFYRPPVTKYLDNGVICACDCRNRASQEELPQTSFGARLFSIVVMLSGYYHCSWHQVKLTISHTFDAKISLGSISNIEKRATQAITSGVQEAWQKVHKAKVKHTDGEQVPKVHS